MRCLAPALVVLLTFLGITLPASAQCAGYAVPITSSSSGSTQGSFLGDPPCNIPYLSWSFGVDCFNDCNSRWMSSEVQNETAHGACTALLPPQTCHPYFIQLDYANGQYATTNAMDMKIFAGCRDDFAVITQANCPCAPACSSGLPGGQEEEDPGTEPPSDPLYGSPIVISLEDGQLELTAPEDGVLFDIDADGTPERMAWTAAGTDDAFLVLDRDQDGTVDHGMELFGDYSPQLPSAEPNGFSALAMFDDSLNGGNDDGWIDGQDPIFVHLQVWTDLDHDGISQPEELQSLTDAGITALGLDYGSTRRRDRHGNQLRYDATVLRTQGPGARVAWDVFFRLLPEGDSEAQP